MSDDPKAVVEGALSAANEGQESALERVSSRYRLYERGELVAKGPEGVEHRMKALRDAMDDFTQEVDAVVRDGNVVVMRWTARGTRRGRFLDVEPDHEPVVLHGVTWSVVENGEITDTWMYWDRLQLLEQINKPAE